ncbi:MAG: hypothetical protein OEZ39_03040 [Gammaproteobacteria bacterium]|nr:hypothetical protein [Gammaproteobacteria bacterium]MDH5650832.1 hypothetical protein [Gammaproteobacteria bacterium]
MKKMLKKFAGILALFCITTFTYALPVTYYDLDFEDGLLHGDSGAFGPDPVIVSSSPLGSGNAVFFDLTSQYMWNLNGPDSLTHYIAFDFYAEAGANIVSFLDIPTILRSDVSVTGTHRLELFFDFTTQSSYAFLDGIMDNNLISIEAWPATPASRDIRIGNQTSAPGNSTGVFYVDNLVWQGNVDIPSVSEANANLLFLAGLILLAFYRYRKINFYNTGLG